MIKLALKILVSGLLIWWLVGRSDMSQVVANMSAADPWGLALALAMMFALAALQSFRWSLVIRAIGAAISFKDAFLNVLIGLFFNQLLPSSIGGDAVRVWRTYRLGLGVGTATHSVMLDRLSALFALAFMATVGSVQIYGYLGGGVHWWGLAVLVAGTLAGFGVLFAFDRLPRAWIKAKPLLFIAGLSAHARSVLLRPRHAVPVLICSVVTHVGVAMLVFVIARSMDLPVEPVDCLILVPAVIFISMIPISIAGWGLRESAMVTAFGLAGVGADEAFALSVLFGLVIMAGGIPGGVLWLLYGSKGKSAQTSAPHIDENRFDETAPARSSLADSAND